MKPVQLRTPAFLLLGIGLVAGGLLARAPQSTRAHLHDAARRVAHSPRVTGDLGAAGHECRFWGLVGQAYPDGLLEEQLLTAGHVTLRSLGAGNRDGWGFAAFPAGGELRALLDGPLVRRGGPASDSPPDPNFERAVLELKRIRPRALLGHVRAGSSGHWGIPNPHPFLHGGFAFAHNGTVSFDICQEMMDVEIPGWRAANPPEYVRGNIDSEIYFQWLLCHAQAHPELPLIEAVREAVEMFQAQAPTQRFNFVMTRGDTLLALRCSAYDSGDPVRYFPNDDPSSPYWVVASQPVGAEPSRWSTLPEGSLGVFVPGLPPAFYPVRGQAEATFQFRAVRVTPTVDGDADGRCCAFRLTCRPDVTVGRHPVRLRLLRLGDEVAEPLAESEPLWLAAGSPDSIRVDVAVEPEDLTGVVWNLALELVELTDPPAVVLRAGSDADPAWGLAGLRVEGAADDAPTPPPLPSDPRDEIGFPFPNPTAGGVTIPVEAASRGGTVDLQIWDARGALVYANPREPQNSSAKTGERTTAAITWNGETSDGHRAPGGVYFARVRVGERTVERRIVLAR